jgi:hypothetical protein
MATWHQLGARDELLARVPFAVKLDRHRITVVHYGGAFRADVVLIATSIRWGTASGLYFEMAERLNCVQNQITTHNRVLINNKVAGSSSPAARTTCGR